MMKFIFMACAVLLVGCRKNESTLIDVVTDALSNKGQDSSWDRSIPVDIEGHLVIASPHSLSGYREDLENALGKKIATKLAALDDDWHDRFTVALITQSGRLTYKRIDTPNVVFNGLILVSLNPGQHISLEARDHFLMVGDSVVFERK